MGRGSVNRLFTFKCDTKLRLVSTTKSQHQVQRRLFLDVVVRKSTAILKLLSSKDQALLFRRNSLFVLNLGLHVGDGVVGFDIQSDGLASERLHEDLHSTTSETKHKVQGGLFLDVVVRKSTAILKLLACKDQTLLLRRNSLFVLNLRLHIGDGVVGFDIQSDGLARERLHEDLHGTTSK